MMLEAAERFKKAFRRMESEDYSYLSFFDDDPGPGHMRPPKAREWETMRVFVKFFRVFYDITNIFSRSLYVTVNTSFLEICDLQNELIMLNNSSLRSMAINMRTKFDKSH